jgi:hypothetical protein
MNKPENPPMEEATLLDFFAAAALGAWIQCDDFGGSIGSDARNAYASAEAMLAERARRMKEKPE